MEKAIIIHNTLISVLMDNGLSEGAAKSSISSMIHTLCTDEMTWSESMETIRSHNNMIEMAVELYGMRSATAAYIFARENINID